MSEEQREHVDGLVGAREESERMAIAQADIERGLSLVRPVGRHVSVLVLPRETRVGSILLAGSPGRVRRGYVLRVGGQVNDVRPGTIIEFNPYALKVVHGRAGWRGANSEVGEPGDVAVLDYEECIGEYVT